jgi:hypothetical protein
MRESTVFQFLRHVGAQPELRRQLRTLPKPRVLAEAQRMGFTFDESDFDEIVWGAESFLASKLGEPFSPQFSLWETMWGKYYLDFVLDNVVCSFTPELEQEFLSARGAT